MKATFNYMSSDDKCSKCKDFLLDECNMRPVEGATGLSFRAMANGWRLCKCGFVFHKRLRGTRLK